MGGDVCARFKASGERNYLTAADLELKRSGVQGEKNRRQGVRWPEPKEVRVQEKE